MKSIVAIIQARTGSKRLPRKVLKKISNISLIEWVILRLKKSRRIKKNYSCYNKTKKGRYSCYDSSKKIELIFLEALT